MVATGITLGSMPRAKGPAKNQGTPPGDFAEFLRWRLKNRFGGERSRLAKALSAQGVTAGEETIKKWEQGSNSPKLIHFNHVAKALGYDDWFDLVSAIRRFKSR